MKIVPIFNFLSCLKNRMKTSKFKNNDYANIKIFFLAKNYFILRGIISILGGIVLNKNKTISFREKLFLFFTQYLLKFRIKILSFTEKSSHFLVENVKGIQKRIYLNLRILFLRWFISKYFQFRYRCWVYNIYNTSSMCFKWLIDVNCQSF